MAEEQEKEIGSRDDLFSSLLEKTQFKSEAEEEVPLYGDSESVDNNNNQPEVAESSNDISPDVENNAEQDEDTSEGAEELNTDSSLSAKPESKDHDSAAQRKADIEEFFVKGNNGRKQKIKIDYSDRAGIKKAYQLAAGMRKFQAERDERNQLVKPLETVLGKNLDKDSVNELVSLKEQFDKLDSVFQEDGIRGLANLLSGKEDAWEEAVNAELSYRQLPEQEKLAREQEKREQQYQKQIAAEREKREQFERKISEREEQAFNRELQSKLEPAFDRYRFAGKLGDAEAENAYDEAVWNKVKSRLSEYPDDMELTQATIDKEFRSVSNMYRKHISKQAEQKLQKTLQNKKEDAAKRIRLASKKGLKNGSKVDEARAAMAKGDMTSAWKNLFGGK